MSQSDASPDLCEFAPAAYSVSTIVGVSQGLAIIRQWQYGVGRLGTYPFSKTFMAKFACQNKEMFFRESFNCFLSVADKILIYFLYLLETRHGSPFGKNPSPTSSTALSGERKEKL